MKEKLRYIMAAVFVFAACLSVASCTAGTDAEDVDDGRMQVSIGLRVPLNPRTGDGFEPGSMYENYIDVTGDNYQIYFFDTDNRFIARFLPSSLVAVEGTNYVDYTVQGEVPEALLGHSSFKVVMLANWPTYKDDDLKADVTTIEQLCNADWAQFDFFESFELGPNNLIPFYGVHEYKDVTFMPGIATVLKEPVTLLRAVAKVEVILDTKDDSGDYLTDVSFSKVSICRYNAKGYCAPSGVYSQKDYGQGNDGDKDYLSGLHLVGDKNSPKSDPYSFQRVTERTDTENEKWIAYLPEYDNSGNDYSYIEVTLASQTEESTPYHIYFSEYADGECADEGSFFNIARNNLYRFTVRVRNGKIEVIVKGWNNAYDNDYTFE